MTRILTVPDMSCRSCAATVSNAVRRIPGVSEVSVDLAAGTVRVAAPDSVPTAELAAAIAAAGYTVAGAAA